MSVPASEVQSLAGLQERRFPMWKRELVVTYFRQGEGGEGEDDNIVENKSSQDSSGSLLEMFGEDSEASDSAVRDMSNVEESSVNGCRKAPEKDGGVEVGRRGVSEVQPRH